ncbi:16S rRNA (cytosine(967)-C(5))-methyltransferase RsmB [Zwartia panacis]|uniref:16S rRNA (cytosine(967)-C(5))-methyltransferase RsmB n=1 Tax=Zwartia panacis TaxID=2683345 RepID=UPI0025B4E817|nr:16S rRNA (cytosine(967)-C(5))-methyltransferase RsmB [Zwartia panacis]MDN4017204.1 16S rRNA (cytosine(967)-C(5))-methyltransferase RsmB [Zwartia panacis]
MNPVTPALSHSLLAAASSVAAVESGQSLTEALADVHPDVRPAAQALAFYAMRHWGWAKAVRRTLVEREPASATMYALIGLSLLLLDASIRAREESPAAGTPVYSAHTLVDQAVQATQWHRSTASFKGLVNAVLRRFQRERAVILSRIENDLEATWNHPRWWIESLQKNYPQNWQALLAAANAHPPLTLRVNIRATTRETVERAFAEQGIETTPFGVAGLVLRVPRPITSLPGYAQGWWSVQDAGAQLAAPMLDVKDGMQVLDACAAPGGKTAHLLELAKVDLTALDVDATRLERVHQNLKRLGLMRRGVRLVAESAIKTHIWWDGKPFDAVLADLPCTASGIVSRHPDIRWLRRAQDVQQTAKLAREILDSLWSVVAPGGKLLMVTCSIFPEEGEQQAQAFAAQHAQAERLSAPGQLLPHLPDAEHPAGYDGFFYALFTRRT